MAINSVRFLIYFLVVAAVYFILPKKLRVFWLLAGSYGFYMSQNPKFAILLAAATLTTWLGALLIEKTENRTRKKTILGLVFVINLGMLAVFKYANFTLESLSAVFSRLGLGSIDKRLDLLLPLGISFYTFQSLGYVMDVYREKEQAEKNIFRYALFISFFPTITAGPIERAGNLLRQIRDIEKIRLWNYERVCDGILLTFWGMFEKMVIADRIALYINQVYPNYQDYGFVELGLASILFTIQIYCDFGGYSHMAQGIAQILGFQLRDNFKQPYLATSIKDFWRRWHISLTSWFTDYLYIPLGGNRKGNLRKYLNILIVFAVSGLWHGSSWNFVVWGLLHAFFQIGEDLLTKLTRKYFPQQQETFSSRLRKRIVTFLLVNFAWVFFAADNLKHALRIFKRILRGKIWTTSIYQLGLRGGDWLVLIASILILLLVDYLHEKGIIIRESLHRQESWFRAAVYLLLFWTVLMLGIYGVEYDTSTFMYANF